MLYIKSPELIYLITESFYLLISTSSFPLPSRLSLVITILLFCYFLLLCVWPFFFKILYMRSHDGCLFVSLSKTSAGFIHVITNSKISVFFKVDKIHLSFDNCIELETKIQHIFITPESSSCPTQSISSSHFQLLVTVDLISVPVVLPFPGFHILCENTKKWGFLGHLLKCVLNFITTKFFSKKGVPFCISITNVWQF